MNNQNNYAPYEPETPYNNKKISFHASPPVDSGYRVSHDCCLVCKHSFWPIMMNSRPDMVFHCGIEMADQPDMGSGIMKCKKHCIEGISGVLGGATGMKIIKEPCEVLPDFICNDFEKE